MATSVDKRLTNVETRLGTLEISVARVEEKLEAHMVASTTYQNEMRDDMKTLVANIEPLREARWKQAGATTVLGALSGAAVSFAIAALKLFR